MEWKRIWYIRLIVVLEIPVAVDTLSSGLFFVSPSPLLFFQIAPNRGKDMFGLGSQT